jgi:hypothetical protein
MLVVAREETEMVGLQPAPVREAAAAEQARPEVGLEEPETKEEDLFEFIQTLPENVAEKILGQVQSILQPDAEGNQGPML